MERWYPVANMSIPHVVWTYEYAETGLQQQSMYETYSLFHLHMCLVCGSYQCPYCPFYNAAPVLSMSVTVVGFIAGLLLLFFVKP
jgi:CD109 antigen